jgi:hypothetical protein
MPLERIMKEKTSADHLLYVSMKYTKTCDVMLNLIERWRSMTEMCIDAMLDKLKKGKKVSVIPVAPKMKTIAVREQFKKEPIVINTLDSYEFFKKIPQLEIIRQNEFRKNVCLSIIDGKEVRIDMDKLKEYAQIMEDFVKYVRIYLASKG